VAPVGAIPPRGSAMLSRKLLWSVPLAGAIGAGVAADRFLAAYRAGWDEVLAAADA